MKIIDEERQKTIDAFVAEHIKKEQDKEDFKTQKMDATMEKLYHHIQEHGFIDNERLSYFPQEHNFERKDFTMSFDHIFEFANDANRNWKDKENSFPNGHCQVRFKDIVIELRMMQGQGTAYQMWEAEEENELVFGYEEFKTKSGWIQTDENGFWEVIDNINNPVFKDDVRHVCEVQGEETVTVKKPGINYDIECENHVIRISFQDKNKVLKTCHYIEKNKYNVFQY